MLTCSLPLIYPNIYIYIYIKVNEGKQGHTHIHTQSLSLSLSLPVLWREGVASIGPFLVSLAFRVWIHGGEKFLPSFLPFPFVLSLLLHF